MITGISIENFKLFGKRVDIELAPITLLFGRNSSGKSSVLQALQYARQVVVDGDATASDPVLGGFRNLVHGRAGVQKITIELRTAPSPADLLEHFSYHHQGLVEDLAQRIQEPAISFTTVSDRWHDQDSAFVRDWTILERQAVRMTLASQAGSPSPVLWANLTDPDGWFSEDVNEGLALALKKTELKSYVRWGKDLEQLIETGFAGHYCMPGRKSALPAASLSLELAEDAEDLASAAAGLAELDAIARGSRSLLGHYLSAIRHIGPMRVLPPRGLVDFGWPKPADWYDGSAAWALMQRDPNLATREVGPVLITMGTGYRIVSNEMAVVDNPGSKAKNLRAYSREPDGAQRVADLADDLEVLPRTHGLHIRDDRTYMRVHPRDVGVGVSQLIPVIAAAVAEREPQPDGSSRPIGLVAIEQPELHVHPAVQSNLGSLFADVIRGADGELSGRQFLIETHS